MAAEFPNTPARRLPITRVESIYSAEAERCVKERIPFVTRITDWGVLKWNLEYLSEKVGQRQVELVRTADGERFTTSFAHLLELTKDPYWRRQYMPVDGGGPLLSPQQPGRRDPDLECLRQDYNLPSWLNVDELSTQVLFRNSGADTSNHFQTPAHWEFDAMSFLSMQVMGRKRVWLFGPDQAPYLGMSSELPDFPFLSVGAPACGDPEAYPQIKDATCYEALLEPGDMIYWPAFWIHWFVHYHDYQISFRVKFPQENHPLNPISASWAFSNALARALGGFEKAEAAYTALPDETKALLKAIEESFFQEPKLVESKAMILQRFNAEVMKRMANSVRTQFQKSGGKDPVGALEKPADEPADTANR